MDMAGALGSMLTGWFSGDDKSSSVSDSKQNDDSDLSQQHNPRLLHGRTVEDVPFITQSRTTRGGCWS